MLAMNFEFVFKNVVYHLKLWELLIDFLLKYIANKIIKFIENQEAC